MLVSRTVAQKNFLTRCSITELAYLCRMSSSTKIKSLQPEARIKFKIQIEISDKENKKFDVLNVDQYIQKKSFPTQHFTSDSATN
jgi:hypothetical protein